MEGQELNNFVSGLAQVLANRKNPNVMVIIESETGMEIISNVQNFVWQFGLLRVADETVAASQRRISSGIDFEKAIRSTASDMESGANIMKGPKN